MYLACDDVLVFVCLMLRRPPISTRTDTLLHYTTLVRAHRPEGRTREEYHGDEYAWRPDRRHGGHDHGVDPFRAASPCRRREAGSQRTMGGMESLGHAGPPDWRQGVGHYRHGAHWSGSGASRARLRIIDRSEEHTSDLQSLMRLSYAVFCLK